MNTDFAVQLLAQALLTAATVSAPMLLLILVVGLLVNVGQVVTQLQEMTLSFIPKLIGLALLLVLAGPWMLGKLGSFTLAMLRSISSIH